MRKILLFGTVLLGITSLFGCMKSGNGELVGVQDRGKWSESQPYGMVYVRRGSFNIGPSDQDASFSGVPTKTVSQEAFWMDDTEITNNEYRQFVGWVRDSIARKMLSDQFPEFQNTEDRKGNPIDPPTINWHEKIDWNDPDIQMAMQDMYIPENERFFGKKEIDTRKLIYEFWWIDLQQAAKRSNSYNFETQRYEGNVYNARGELVPIENRSSFILNDKVHVYPDTLSWIRDFTYSYNEPWATRYFWHPGFDDYPVVGVTWNQARAFCNWRTKIQSDYLSSKGEPDLHAYRLPSEVEWEYAARGGKNFSMYPWGGYYTRDDEGVFLANFKPLRGNYVEDGGISTMKVGSYEPNEYGLYDMSGNVAEWTETAYDEAGYHYFSDLNPSFTYNARPDDPPVMKRKVIRGGSWKDIAQFVQVSTRSFEYQDTTKSFIGFRCVRSTFGDEFN
ncbi:MAG: gliding motility-associated lipoprotein [Bacteroidia bacterium]|nr:gliding motility-associated lipoprotein [Bacteroidia bacterium]